MKEIIALINKNKIQVVFLVLILIGLIIGMTVALRQTILKSRASEISLELELAEPSRTYNPGEDVLVYVNLKNDAGVPVTDLSFEITDNKIAFDAPDSTLSNVSGINVGRYVVSRYEANNRRYQLTWVAYDPTSADKLSDTFNASIAKIATLRLKLQNPLADNVYDNGPTGKATIQLDLRKAFSKSSTSLISSDPLDQTLHKEVEVNLTPRGTTPPSDCQRSDGCGVERAPDL